MKCDNNMEDANVRKGMVSSEQIAHSGSNHFGFAMQKN